MGQHFLPAFCNFSLTWLYWGPVHHHHPLLFPHSPSKTQSTLQIRVEFSSHWMPFSIAIVYEYYWLKPVLATLTSAWLHLSLTLLQPDIGLRSEGGKKNKLSGGKHSRQKGEGRCTGTMVGVNLLWGWRSVKLRQRARNWSHCVGFGLGLTLGPFEHK